MKVTAGALLSLVAAISLFCAHSAKSEIMVDDPDFAEFTVYNSVTGQQPKATMTVFPERGDQIVIKLRTRRSCSPILEVVLHGHVVGDVARVFTTQIGPVPADTTIEFVWNLCWSPEVVGSLKLMNISKFHKGTMWLDDEGRFLLMPLILERPDLYPVKEGEFLPDPNDYSQVFNAYRVCDNGGIVVLGSYFVCIRTDSAVNTQDDRGMLDRIKGEYRSGIALREGYAHLRWRYISIWSEDPGFVPRKWPERRTRTVDELRGE